MTNKYEPAFPVTQEVEWTGLSMRDYFAAKAMEGALAYHGPDELNKDGAAQWSYKMADAMMKERAECPK